jgi:A/G-specific adenine glycosylase
MTTQMSEGHTLTPATEHAAARIAPRFRRDLLSWFDQHKRDLPWRRTRDPYRIWLSEIMLQQTRVAAAVEYYERFLLRFPTIQKLATARQSSVLAAWSGLGYYRRARMLHVAAKEIVGQHAGNFPTTADALRALPGVGRYTAAAIASIAFNEPVAVVDGNVERVLQRVLGKSICGEDLWRSAEQLLSRRRPGDFNQAVMELGATLCVPRQPKCLLCPVAGICATRGERDGPRTPAHQRKREIHYALDCRKGSVFLVQRESSAALMPEMWELPEIAPEAPVQACLSLRHSITKTDYAVRVIQCKAPAGMAGRRVSRSRIEKLPLTGLTRKILRTVKFI